MGMKRFSLRGHHLGAIYTIVARNESTGCDYKKAIMWFQNNLYFMYCYPYSTIKMGDDMLCAIFLEKHKKVLIDIILGPDCICEAKCIVRRESNIKDETSTDYKNLLREAFFSHCLNKKASADMIMLTIFKMKANKTYNARRVVSKSKKLYKKYKACSWEDLVEKQKACSK